MRTIQVVNVRWYNATAWYGVTLAHCLKKAGHTSLVAGLEGSAPLEKARELGLETVSLPFNTASPLKLIDLWKGMNALLKEFRPDIVNCHRGEAFILWALLKQKYGFGLVRTRGDRRLPKGGAINRWLHGSAADAVISTNSLMARHFTEKLHVPQEKLHVIYGGVDTERFRHSDSERSLVRERYGYDESHIVMGLLGRMDEVKGIRESIVALAEARRQSPLAQNIRFLVIGFDSEFCSTDVEGWCKEAGLGALGEVVRITGKVDDPHAVINALDFGILASTGSEAIARAALEIMASGVPLISSTTGVMPDLIPAKYSFAPGDIHAMADRMITMLDAGERQHLAGLCLDRIFKGELTLHDFYEKTQSIYTGILSGGAGSA